eukprot:SAG31_NODE_2560_length_5482_cov_7.141373_2_plen_222_part_00
MMLCCCLRRRRPLVRPLFSAECAPHSSTIRHVLPSLRRHSVSGSRHRSQKKRLRIVHFCSTERADCPSCRRRQCCPSGQGCLKCYIHQCRHSTCKDRLAWVSEAAEGPSCSCSIERRERSIETARLKAYLYMAASTCRRSAPGGQEGRRAGGQEGRTHHALINRRCRHGMIASTASASSLTHSRARTLPCPSWRTESVCGGSVSPCSGHDEDAPAPPPALS